MKKIVIKLPEIVDAKVFDFKPPFQVIGEEDIHSVLKVNNDYHTVTYGFKLSDSEIETFNRHVHAWRTLVNSQDDHALVVEENVEISQLSIDYSDLGDLPENWHVFFPYDMQKIIIENRERMNLLNHNSREVFDIEPYFLGIDWGSSFYFISKAGAAELLSRVKEVRQRVEDEILYQGRKSGLNVCFAECTWLDIERIHKKEHLDRIKTIRHTVLSYSTWTPEAKSAVSRLLEFVSGEASSVNIPLLLQGGSHLGFVRHGGIMGWDDDVDIGIEECRFEEFAKRINKHGYRITPSFEDATSTTYYKVWHEQGIKIATYPYTFPFLDFWLYNKKGDDLIFNNGIVCPKSGSAPFQKVLFEGYEFFIPYNSLEVLDSRYKDWRTMIRIYEFNHANERSINHILCAPIEVDRSGRIIDN